jgi:hypothetical protein
MRPDGVISFRARHSMTSINNGATRYLSLNVVSMLILCIYKDLMMSTSMINESHNSSAQIEIMTLS